MLKKKGSLGLIFLTAVFSFGATAKHLDKRVLIFWYGMGMGHRIAADCTKVNIEKECAIQKKICEIELVDMRQFSIADPLAEESGKRRYLSWAFAESDSYTKYFDWYMEQDPHKVLSNFDLSGVARFLQKKQPDVVVSTFWGSSHALFQLKSQYPELKKLKESLVYTDYGVHQYAQMVPDVQRIDFPSQDLRDEAMRKYPRLAAYGANLSAAGIPVNAELIDSLAEQEKTDLRRALGLKIDADTVFIARGGEAYIPLSHVLTALAEQFEQQNRSYQLLFFGGGHAADAEEIKKIAEKYGDKIKLFERIPNNEYLRYLRASDVFLTKPGGGAITEGALLNVPMVLLKGLGGQEQDNRNEYLKQGMALEGIQKEDILQNVARLFAEPDLVSQIVAAQKSYFSSYAAQDLAHWVLASESGVSWGKLKEDLSNEEKKQSIKKMLNLDALLFKNWYYYLSDTAVADLSFDRELHAVLSKLGRKSIERALEITKTQIAFHKDALSHGDLDEKGIFEAKWQIFVNTIWDYTYHTIFNAKLERSPRQELDALMRDLLAAEQSGVLQRHPGIWEYSQHALYYHMANFYFHELHYSKAKEYIDKALDIAPGGRQNETMVQLKGDILMRQKRYKDAQIFLEKSLQKFPHMRDVRLSLLKLFREQRMYTEANAIVAAAMAEHRGLTESEALRIASYYREIGSLPNAVLVLQKATKSRPKSLFLRGVLLGLLTKHPQLRTLCADGNLEAEYKALRDQMLLRLPELNFLEK